MIQLIASLALALTSLLGSTPAPAPAPAPVAVEVPTCSTMGSDFQCDEERALWAAQNVIPYYTDAFRVTYLTTRLDGVEPVDGPLTFHVQDWEFPNMYHVFELQYAPTTYA